MSRTEHVGEHIANHQYLNPELTELEVEQERQRLLALSDRDFLKWRIGCAERDKADYETLMKDIGMNRDLYGSSSTPEFYDWYKGFVRENLNDAKSRLKELQTEIYHLNQGLNPPYCYPAALRK